MEGAPSPSAIGASWDSARSDQELVPRRSSSAEEAVGDTAVPEVLEIKGEVEEGDEEEEEEQLGPKIPPEADSDPAPRNLRASPKEESPRAPRTRRLLLERLEAELEEILDKQRQDILIHVREFAEHHRGFVAEPHDAMCEVDGPSPADGSIEDPIRYSWLNDSKGTAAGRPSRINCGDIAAHLPSEDLGPRVNKFKSEISLEDVFAKTLALSASQVASRELGRRRMYGSGVRAMLLRMTAHPAYEVISASLIFLNVVVMAWEAQVVAQTHVAVQHEARGSQSHKNLATEAHFAILMYVFCALFVVDLAIHLSAQGPLFFYSVHWRWNIFDVLAVSTYIIEVVVVNVTGEAGWLSGAPVLRVVRLVRIARVVRALRSFRMFREVRVTIAMLCDAVVVLTFCAPMMAVYIMVFGIIFTDGATSYMALEGRDPGLVRYFGDLFTTMRTIFKAMTGGIDWEEASEPLMQLPWPYTALFYVFVTFSTFAILNVINAVFVDLTLNMCREDRDYIVHTEMQAKKDFMNMMNQVFEELDRSGSGSISLAELVRNFMNPEVHAYFRGLDLNVGKVRKLFMLMDTNRSGGIDRREFAEGCTQLRGEAKTLDLAILQGEVQRLSSDAVIIKRLLYRLGDHLHVGRDA